MIPVSVHQFHTSQEAAVFLDLGYFWKTPKNPEIIQDD